jgi:Xaa-Pro aminopeptidase
MTMNERVAALREVMKRENLGAFIFPSTDAHNSEYVADHWKGREWISGFDGSAGVAVVTMHGAALWTDSRYFLAAEKQLCGTEFQLMKLKIPGTPTVAEWIGGQLDGNGEVGVDGTVNSYSFVENLVSDLRHEGGITVRLNFDPLKSVWKDRPSIPNNKVAIHPLEYAGESTESKIGRIKNELRKMHCDGMLVSALDDIAWILNLRGTDVHCNPVFVSYLLIQESNVTLFINKEKLTSEVEGYLESQKISVQEYDNVATYLKRKYFAYNILLDPDETNSYMVAQVEKEKTKVVFAKSPVPTMKAVKNAAEINGFHAAMLRDGVAMVKFLKWLKPAVEAGCETEMSLDRKLTGLRADQKLFKDISFDTIVGYEQHGAIVHYEATEETDIPVKPSGLVLIDSGAQYQDGTTDITRTIALGPLTEEQKKVYTLVLKGHIQLELAKFPDGACGTQLDALAREAMWREGMNFLHGTGHGVGSYLSVHEGPHQIRMEYMSTPLHAGMTVTDEPGLYLTGKFGVRIENTLLIKKYVETEFGQFLQMEPLTLCPIDTLPIVKSMLSDEEKDWLNMYHKMVCDKLLPYLDDSEKRWLIDATRGI